jgi:hypothetical protein
VIPDGLVQLRGTLEEMIDAGASKFVVVPFVEPHDWTAELEELAGELLPLQA